MNGQRRTGFTIAELLVVVVIGSFLVLAVNKIFIQQRRFSLWEQEVVATHDAFRVASSILSAELREAVAEEGDILLPKKDSILVRSPIGFGVVCSKRTTTPAMGVGMVQGSMLVGTTDSLLLSTTYRWRALRPTGELATSTTGFTCPWTGATAPTKIYTLPAGIIDSITVGSPMRVYQRHGYHRATYNGESWLARTDPSGTQMIVGPLVTDGITFRLLDAAGSVTTNPSLVRGVELELIMPLSPTVGQTQATRDTIRTVFQGRNR